MPETPESRRRTLVLVLAGAGALALLALGGCFAAVALYFSAPREQLRSVAFERAGGPVEILVGGRSLGTTPLVLDDATLAPYWREGDPGAAWPAAHPRSGGASGSVGGSPEILGLWPPDRAAGRDELLFGLREGTGGRERYLLLPFRALDASGVERRARFDGTTIETSPRRISARYRIAVE